MSAFVTPDDAEVAKLAAQLDRIAQRLRHLMVYGKCGGRSGLDTDFSELSLEANRLADHLRAKAHDWCGCGDSKRFNRERCENCDGGGASDDGPGRGLDIGLLAQ